MVAMRIAKTVPTTPPINSVFIDLETNSVLPINSVFIDLETNSVLPINSVFIDLGTNSVTVDIITQNLMHKQGLIQGPGVDRVASHALPYLVLLCNVV